MVFAHSEQAARCATLGVDALWSTGQSSSAVSHALMLAPCSLRVSRCERVVLARGGCDARQGGFDGGRFIVPDIRRKMASDAILVDRRRALQRFLAAGGEHDEQAATIPGRRRSLHEASLLDPIDQ